MKRFLMVLLLTVMLSVPAFADVLVYNAKQAEVEMQNASGVWLQVAGSYTDYFVIEPNASGTADVWSIMTYKAKDKNGKPQNYYTTQNMGALTLLQVQVGTKQKWIISGSTSQFRIVLTGDGKPGKPAPGDHGNGPFCSNCHSSRPDRVATPDSAPSMTGSSIWDETTGADRAIGTAKISIKLDAKTTAQVAKSGYNPSEAVNYIVSTLKGYILGS